MLQYCNVCNASKSFDYARPTLLALLFIFTFFHPAVSHAVNDDKKTMLEKFSHAVILQYHHVDSTTPHATSISPELFTKHLNWLEQHHFQIWPLDKLVLALKSGSTIPDKVVAITFDDGYRDNFDNAYPLLKQRKWPFTLFLNTQPVEQEFPSHMSWQQLKELQRNGVLIANHSATHPFMVRRLQDENEKRWRLRLKGEIITAQQSLEKHLGTSPKLFAYPYGESTPEIRKMLASMGYTAFGQQSGPVGSYSDLSNLPRFAVSGDYADLSGFAEKMWTLPLPVTHVRVIDNTLDEILPNALNKPQLELSLGLAEPFVSLSRVSCFATGQGAVKSTILKNRQTLNIRLEKPLPIGRSRINCTAPSPFSSDDNRVRFYWHSHQLIRLGEHNQWQHE